MGRAAPNLTGLVCFLVLAMVEPNSAMLRAGPVFAAVNVFLALRAPLIMIPESIMYVQHISVSFARVTHFLLLPESAPAPAVPPGSLRKRRGDVVIRIAANSRFELRGKGGGRVSCLGSRLCLLVKGLCMVTNTISHSDPLHCKVQVEVPGPALRLWPQVRREGRSGCQSRQRKERNRRQVVICC